MEIFGSEALVARFGEWPSFHDATVQNCELRSPDPQSGQAEMTWAIHVFEMTSDVDERGYFRLKNHLLVTLLFEGLYRLNLEDIMPRAMILMDLHIETIDTPLPSDGRVPPVAVRRQRVEWVSAYGMSGELECAAIRVVSVDSCDSQGGILPSVDTAVANGGHAVR